MDINELESFKLSDAVKFHKELNPRLWQDEKLDPEVRDQLLVIAEDFVEYLGLSNLKVKDVTISGSNAAYSYTPHSDLDLHVLVDFNELPDNEVYQELFTAKKTLYNDAHDITVHGVPVELYVQDINQPVQSLGEYSIVHDKWIRVPKRRRANFDQAATKLKYEKLGELIEVALKSQDPKRVNDTIALVKRYRKAGLDKTGEFGPENLAYKAVRKQGLVQALYDLKAKLHADKLSIEEEHKILNKPTLSVAELAEKHGVSRMEIAKQLDKGIKVELEHTSDRNVAKEIASDHIAEDPKYYDKLAKVDLEEAPRTFQSQSSPIEKLIQAYGYFTSLGNVHLDKQGQTPEAQQQLLALVQRLNKDGKVFAGLDKSKIESNRDAILNHIHQMMTYAIPVLQKYLPGDVWEAKRNQVNSVLQAYNDARNTLNEGAESIADTIKSSLGLKQFIVTERGDDLILDSLIVGKENQGKGLGTTAMKQLIDYADQNGKRIILTPGLQNKEHGTTSRTRLVKFYKSLGFKENKGRSIDFAMGAGKMYRDPAQSQINETAQESQLVNLISKNAANIIVKMLRKKESQLAKIIAPDIKRQKLEVWGISAEQLGVPYINDPVLSQVLSHSKFRVVDRINPTNPGTMATYSSQTHDVTVYYPTIVRHSEKSGYELAELLAKTIAHELQHAVDNFKSQGKAFKTGKTSYPTLPYEINARFQEALMNMSMEFDHAKKMGKTLPREHLPAFIDVALEHNGISQYLPKTGSRYKQLAKRMFKFFDAELNNPKREKPLSLAKRAMNFIFDKPTKEIAESELMELADMPYSYREIGKTGNQWTYSFETENGNEYHAQVFITPSTRRAATLGIRYGIEVHFFLRQDGEDKEGIENTGNAVKVFSTIAKITMDAVKKVNPDTIRIIGKTDEPSRVKLYTALANRALKLLPEYEMHHKDTGTTPDGEEFFAIDLAKKGVQSIKLGEASGYIPSEKEKNDPRFKTALTVDINPNSIKKNAKAFGWKTSRAGIPPQANPSGKIAEDLMKEWKSFLAEEQEQQELFPGYDKEHREKRLDNWLQNTHAWDGHKPRVFYHATTKDFDTFNTHGTGFSSALGMAFEVERHGSFFAVDPRFAESFIIGPHGEYKEGGRVIPVFLSVQNPIDLRDNNLSHMISNDDTVDGFKANDIDLRSIYYHISEYQRWELFDGPEGAEFVDNLQKLGFDSAIINEIPESAAKSGEVWVVFNPNQVKSIHNRGSFSPDDPRLMKEATGQTVTLYHGTCEGSAQKLLTTGWIPNAGQRGGNMGQSRYLYCSTHYDDALWFAQEKGCDTVLKLVDVPLTALRVDPEDGTADTLEDELNSPHGLPGKVVVTRPIGPEHFKA